MPTFDPKDLPSYTRPSTYDVSSFQSSLQRSFERWLEAPSPTSERLVDQALIGAGREPLFAMSASRDPRISRGIVSAQQNSFKTPAGRAPPFRGAGGRFTSSPSYSGPAYADPRFNGPSGAQQFGSYRGTEAYTATTIISTREAARLFKHIDQTLDSMNRAEHQILELSRTSVGRGSGSVRGGYNNPIIGAAPASRFLGMSPGSVTPGYGPPMPPMMPPGGGGGGSPTSPGGGGGRGGGGAGGGNAFTGGLLGGALGRNGFWGAVAGEGATLAARWPLHLGHVVEGVLRSSSPYADWQSRLADMTALPASIEQSDRSRRLGLERDLLPYAGGKVPGWMSGLGITPQMGADILGRMGGGVQTGTEPLQMIQNFRELRLGAGFRMAPEGSAEALGMLGQKYGITQPGQQAGFPGAFAQYLAQGQSGGADVKDLLKSISESTEALVKTGIKLDLSQTMGWADFLQRMATVNLPGAQSGQMGGNIISGMQGAGQHPFANPVTATIFSQLINQTDWSDPAQVKKMLGKTPEEIMSGGADWEKTGLGMLQKSKTDIRSMAYGARMIAGSPNGLSAAGGIVGQMGGSGVFGDSIRQMLMGSFLGQDFVTGSGALAGIKARTPSDIVGAATPMPGTLPSEVFRSQTEAFTAAFRGMRADFEEFGSRIHWVNSLLDGFIDQLNTWFGRKVPNSGVPGIPPGGQKIPGGYEAPIPGLGILGAGKPGFGSAGEYGVGQGVIPSGGSSIPRSAGRLGPQSFEAISRAEGTFGQSGINYNMLHGGGVDPDLSNKTLTEAAAISRRIGDGVGGFQIIHSNIMAGAAHLGLNPNTTKFTPEVQQQLAGWVNDKQGPGAWRGFKLHPEELSRFRSGLVSPSSGGGGGLISGAQAAPMPGFAGMADRTKQFGVGFRWGQMSPEGMIIHHTGGRGSTEDVMNVLGQRGLGSQFIIDREGRVSRILPEGAKGRHIMQGWGPKGEGRSNANMQGVEIVARDDKDINQTQVNSALALIKNQSKIYGYDPLTSVFGHGEVNPGHKDPREGMTVVDAVRSGALAESGVTVERRGSGGPVDKHDEDTTSPSRQNFSWDDIHDAVGFLGRMARETGEHLSDLGHGARSARSGMASPAGPNTSTSPSPNPAAAAYP